MHWSIQKLRPFGEDYFMIEESEEFDDQDETDENFDEWDLSQYEEEE